MSELERRVARWRFELGAALCSEGAVRVSSMAAGFILAAVLLDRLFILDQNWRWLLFYCSAAIFVLAVFHFFLRPLKRLETLRLLREVSELRPGLSAYLVSAWELSRKTASRGISEPLIREHLRRTEKLLSEDASGRIFSSRPSLGASKGFISVAACWALGLPVLGTGSSFQRILAPWRDAVLEKKLEISPGDAALPWASSVKISAAWTPFDPIRDLELWMKTEDSPWGRVPLERFGRNAVSYSLSSLTGLIEYRFESQGIRSKSYRLTPVPPPRLMKIAVKAFAPGGGVSEYSLEGRGEISEPRRSWIVLSGRESTPLSAVRIDVSALGQPVEMKKIGKGLWEGGFPLNEDGRISISAFADRNSGPPGIVSYPLRALKDEPPQAELLSPAFELEVSRFEKLQIAFAAEDDASLKEIVLTYSVKGREEKKPLVLKRFADPIKSFLGDFSWDLSEFKPGESVQFAVRAFDGARPQAQFSDSAPGLLHIVDFETAHALAAARWIEAESLLDELAESEGRLAAELKASGEAPLDAALAERARQSDAGLDAAWSKASSAMNRLSEAMEKDAYANPGLSESAQALSESLQSMKRNELAEARRLSREGKSGESGRAHEALSSRVKRAKELMNSGRELQAMQDFWGEAQKMESSGKEIAEALDKFASGKGTPGSEEKKALDEALSKLRESIDAMQKAIKSLPDDEADAARSERRTMYSIPLSGAKEKMDALEEALARGDYAEAAKIAKRLAEQLGRVHEAIANAARSFSEENENSPGGRMEEIARRWEEAISEQSKGLSMTDALEREALAGKVAEQKKLLKELAERQREAVKSAASIGAKMPDDAFSWMGRVLSEFEQGTARESAGLLERTISRLGMRSRELGPDGESLRALGRTEEGILEALRNGSTPPAFGEAQLEAMFAAGAVQRQAGKKTADLREEIRKFADDFGSSPDEAARSLEGAISEQSAAEAALGRRDSGAAMEHQQKALDHLSQGKNSLEKEMQRQESISRGSSEPFSRRRGMVRPAGEKGKTGSDTGFVPLPGAKDYQPPRRIREEVERSLREKRPRVFEDAVDGYLRRMSQ